MMSDDLPVMTFEDRPALRAWLERNHRVSAGIRVRIPRTRSGVPGIAFEDLLEEGLCFGWSESQRTRGDEAAYLQRFTPRRRPGTASERNRRLVDRLIADGRMTEAGLQALGMRAPTDRLPSRPTPGA
jgi:uncharacterized protein YdeI (YjbR/CyaY-like superfamily)